MLNTKHLVGAALAALSLANLSACNGDVPADQSHEESADHSHGESADHSHEAVVELPEGEPGPVTDLSEIDHDVPEEMTFGELVGLYSSADHDTPEDLPAALDASQAVISGEVVDLVEGRKVMLGDGSDPNYYVRHLNIIIRTRDVIKGMEQAEEVALEIPWPQNLSTKSLQRTLPRGQSTLVIGEPVADSESDIPVLSVPPYGFVIEKANGDTQVPFDDDREFHESVKNGEKRGFRALQEEVARAVGR